MGNLYAESGLRANNLQNSYEKKLNITDAEYTRLVDENAYPDFVKDKAGYGLAQWTFWSRKQALLDFAKSKGKSIGDLQMQLDFLWKELTMSYESVVSFVEADIKNILELNQLLSGGTHGPAGKFTFNKLVQVKKRVEQGINFLCEISRLA